MRRALVGAAFAVALGTGRAWASGFQLIEQNGSGMGNAYSGQAAAAEDPSAIFFNPAGLTRLPGLQLSASLNFIGPSFHFENGGSVAAPLQQLGGTGGDAGSLELVPNGYASYETLPGVLWTGIGVNVPFGLATEWSSDWMGRFHAIKSEVKSVNINPTVAWKALQWLSLGAGANAQWFDAELTNSVNYSAILAGAGAPPTPGLEGLGKVTGSTWSWGWNVGAMVDLLQTKTRIGLSYRSRITHHITGDVTFSNRPPPLATALPDGPVKTTIEVPDTASVAVAQQIIPKLELLADYTWTGWSSIQDLSIFRTTGQPLTNTSLRFDDSWRVGLGANYQLTEPVKLRLGVAYDKTPVRNEFRTPRLPDEDRTWIAGGVQWAFSKQGAIDFGIAYLFVKNASSNLPSVDPNPNFPAVPNGQLVGSYSANVWLGSIQARYSL
jgi:long-chain fatty acid transport protein